MSQRILVIGGTGMLGEPVARQLKADGFTVRILTRNLYKTQKQFGEEFEVFSGNVLEPLTLNTALQDCQGVHINLRGGNQPKQLIQVEHEGTVNALNAATKMGASRISMISYAADLEKHPKVAYAWAKHLAETALIAGEVPWTIFRATHFMESLKMYFKKGQAYVIGDQPHAFHWLAVQDYARMVSAAFQKPEAAKKRFTVFGPEGLTFQDALTKYCEILTPQSKVTKLPIGFMKLAGRLKMDVQMLFIADLMKFFSEAGEQGDPTEANELLGTPTTTLDEWLKEQK